MFIVHVTFHYTTISSKNLSYIDNFIIIFVVVPNQLIGQSLRSLSWDVVCDKPRLCMNNEKRVGILESEASRYRPCQLAMYIGYTGSRHFAYAVSWISAHSNFTVVVMPTPHHGQNNWDLCTEVHSQLMWSLPKPWNSRIDISQLI